VRFEPRLDKKGRTMNDNRPQIISCSGLFFFTTPVYGDVSTLVPSHLIDRATGPWISNGNTYFIVGLSDFSKNAEAKVQSALEHIWSQLVSRNLATGPMPTPVEGNPSDMLH